MSRVSSSTLSLGIAPALFSLLFAVRAFRPVVDPVLVAILSAMLACVVGILVGSRWTAAAFLVFPVALIVSPSGRELSFNLASPDSDAWRWYSIAALVMAGLAVSSCVALLLLERVGFGVGFVGLGVSAGVVVGVAMVGLVRVVAPVTVFATDLTAAERDALAKVALVDFAYAPLDIPISPDGVTRVLLVNTSDLPHTVTLETGGSIDVDVYVPARREAVLEVDGRLARTDVVPFFCAIGDHRELGMIGNLVVGPDRGG